MEGYGNENPGAFQPTRPLRGATCLPSASAAALTNFNPRAPCGARHVHRVVVLAVRLISTHAPLAGRDCHRAYTDRDVQYFNPRAPCGARRLQGRGDQPAAEHFNPRAPCGARLGVSAVAEHLLDFNPRAPCGARPCSPECAAAHRKISTHAPLAGRDGKSIAEGFIQQGFQPTRPLRGATFSHKCGKRGLLPISTHAPLAGRDNFEECKTWLDEFQPTRPLRGATADVAKAHDRNFISTHAPLAGRD